jgi:hypothetical protein
MANQEESFMSERRLETARGAAREVRQAAGQRYLHKSEMKVFSCEAGDGL